MTEEQARRILGLPETEGAHEVPREDAIEEPFFAFLQAIGLDGRGLPDPKARRHPFHDADLTAQIRTPRFVVRSYDWGEGGPDEGLPNFEALQEGLRIWWYKYPFRSATSSLPVSPDTFPALLQDLLASLPPDFPRHRPRR